MIQAIKEKIIEAYLVKRVKQMGGMCNKLQWINRRGAPDRLVILPGRDAFWVELKRPGGKTEPHQAREHQRMRSLGCRIEVVDSFERVDEVLNAAT